MFLGLLVGAIAITGLDLYVPELDKNLSYALGEVFDAYSAGMLSAANCIKVTRRETIQVSRNNIDGSSFLDSNDSFDDVDE